METTITNVTPVNQIAETKQPKIAPVKAAKKSRVITTTIVTKSGLNYSPVFDLENFPKSLGKILNDIPEKFEVKLFGGKITVSGITAKTDNKDRVLQFLKGLALNIFAGMEMQQVLPANETDKYLVLNSIKKAGFKFQAATKNQVVKSVELWAKNKKAHTNCDVQLVTALNLGLIADTSVHTQQWKAMRAENLSALTGLEIKGRKALGLPEPVKA